MTNFEFGGPPLAPEPVGVYAFADPLAAFSATWNDITPLSGAADLLLSFTFSRGPEPYDEWVNLLLTSPETDIRGYERIVVWLASDVPRSIRVRVASAAYDDTFGGIWSEFGVDDAIGTGRRSVSIPLASLQYPPWAKAAWTEGQGFPGTDAEALDLVLSRFSGLVFAPGATVDAVGELVAETETGHLRVDNIYFR
jgi:hypothetical protein